MGITEDKMALIHIWGWRPEPDETTAKRLNSEALERLETRYLELFPNEHVNGILGEPDTSTAEPRVEIIVDCSFDADILDPDRRRQAEQALAETYRDLLSDRPGDIDVTLR